MVYSLDCWQRTPHIQAAIEQLQEIALNNEHQISLLDACCKANAQRIRDNEASIDELCKSWKVRHFMNILN
uniref:Uncharacterized protein n=1 Tax=Trichobilharzia regenti TaxID=157069 RepID=A0AA85JYI6_TRIRE|nr:unnamed protein product [Trichobilharzia regenti]